MARWGRDGRALDAITEDLSCAALPNRGCIGTCVDAIFFVLRTVCQWEALDATDCCPHSTAHDRFQAVNYEATILHPACATIVANRAGLFG